MVIRISSIMTREDITLSIALFGVALGIYNAWWSHHAAKTRLSIQTSWISDFAPAGYRAFCVKVTNLSGFDIVVESISFLSSGRDGHIPLSKHLDSNSHLPRRIVARSSEDFLLSQHFHTIPDFESISRVRVTTGDGSIYHHGCKKMILSPLPNIIKP